VIDHEDAEARRSHPVGGERSSLALVLQWTSCPAVLELGRLESLFSTKRFALDADSLRDRALF
jgi:hypothetical protein